MISGQENRDNKALIVFGSARSDGNTRRAIDLVFPERDLITFCDLNDFVIQPYSYSAEPKDDFLKVAQFIAGHSKIVFATPVYWYAMSGFMKTFFDRFTDLITRQKQIGRSLAGKQTFFIATGTDPELPHGFAVPFARTSEYFSMKFIRGLYFVCEGESIIKQDDSFGLFLKEVELHD